MLARILLVNSDFISVRAKTGLMLMLVMCLGHVFPHSKSAINVTRHSCHGKYMMRYDNHHNLCIYS